MLYVIYKVFQKRNKRVSECWRFYAVSTARVIFTARETKEDLASNNLEVARMTNIYPS